MGQAQLCAGIAEKALVFFKIGRGILIAPYIRAYEDRRILAELLKRMSLGGKHCIDSTYLITHFPACLKEKPGHAERVLHNII